MRKISLIIISVVLFGCKNNYKENLSNANIKCLDSIEHIRCGYEQTNEVNHLFQIEALSMVQLETGKKSFIKRIQRICFTETNIIIQNSLSNILMFDRNGQFVKQIGDKGKGPGEYLNVFSFDVVKNNIIVYDGYKLIFYDLEGTYLKTIYTFKETKIFGDEFCYFNDDNYYLWVSDPAGKAEKINESYNKIFHHLYWIKNGKIKDRYIEGITTEIVRQRITDTYNGFSLSPTRFDNYFYKITKDGIVKDIVIDFKQKINLDDYKIGLTDEDVNYNDTKLKNSGACSFYRSFCDCSSYCYFEYVQKGIIHSLLWNKTIEDGINWQWGEAKNAILIDNQIPFIPCCKDNISDSFVISLIPIEFIQYFKREKKTLTTSAHITSDMINKLNKSNANSNPVLFFVQLR